MKTASLVAAVALALCLSACSGGSDDVTATDPAPTTVENPMPTEAPVPPGEVRTANLATVMDKGTPELCLGPVAESYPPQCGGPEITNWDWDRDGQAMFEQQGDVRWGTFLVTGRWDGTAFEVTETIPGPLYDPVMPEPSDPPRPERDYSQAELESIAQELEALPGLLGAYAVDGHVIGDVMYDDGSLQQWADDEHGAGVVALTSLLVDVG